MKRSNFKLSASSSNQMPGPKSKLALLISKMEGFGKPGTVPTTHHNPGDLRHSPHSEHPEDPNAIGVIDTDEHGWEDLERQLQLYAYRNMTVKDAIYQFAPPTENNTQNYLNFICEGLNCSPDTPISKVLNA